MAKPYPETPEIDGIYLPLSKRLVEFGNQVYADCTSSQRVIMWVFSFYDADSECPVCKHGLERLRDWFAKYGLVDNPVRSVGLVADDDAKSSSVLDDLHIDFAPVNIFTDGDGKVIDILFEFPDEAWLDKNILPFIQKDSTIL
jgi:hypothetical protein